MNKEIKFRAWHKDDKIMSPVIDIGFHDIYGTYKDSGILQIIIYNQFKEKRFSNTEDCILMQYTGMKDKEGKKIYEGDIVKEGREGNIHLVQTTNDTIGFGFEPYNDDYFISGEETE